jgi:hypothetical protein
MLTTVSCILITAGLDIQVTKMLTAVFCIVDTWISKPAVTISRVSNPAALLHPQTTTVRKIFFF